MFLTSQSVGHDRSNHCDRSFHIHVRPVPFPNIPSECHERHLARIVPALVVALVAVVAARVGTARNIAAIGVQPAPGALSYC
jgi:hypothetical protein